MVKNLPQKKKKKESASMYNTWNSCSMLCGSLSGRGVCRRRDTWIYIAESLRCSPEISARNLPCNSGDLDLIPGRGTKIPHSSEQLSTHN